MSEGPQGWSPPGDGAGWASPAGPPAGEPPAGAGSPTGPAQHGSGAPAYGPPPTWGAPPPPSSPGWSGAAPGWRPAPRPGVVPLRPLNLGELIDGAVQTMRQNPKVMFGLSAIVLSVVFVLSTVLQAVGLPQLTGALPSGDDPALRDFQVGGLATGGVLSFVVPVLLQGFATIVLTAVLILAVSEAVVGRKPTIGEVWRRMLPRFWSVLGLSLLSGLVVLGLYAVVAVPAVLLFVGGSKLGGGIAVALGLLVLALAGPFLWVRLAFAGPALLLERIGVPAALARSWRLSLGSWWRAFGILLLTAILAGVVGGIISSPFGILGGLGVSAAGASGSLSVGATTVLSAVLQNLGSLLATTVTAPFSAAVTALLYIDLRMRREGLDVALARAAAEPTQAP